MRPLGIPTVGDRIAQTVVKMVFEPIVEPHFHEDSYGYRPGKSAHDAIGVARKRCWRANWVIDLDIKGFLETSSHYPLSDCWLSKSPGRASGTFILRPFLRPRQTWTA